MKRKSDLRLEILLAVFFIICLLGLTAQATTGKTILPDNVYPATLVVTKYKGGIMTLEQYGTYCTRMDSEIQIPFSVTYRIHVKADEYEDIYVGDVMSAIMYDNGHDGIITNDTILSLQYAGWVF